MFVGCFLLGYNPKSDAKLQKYNERTSVSVYVFKHKNERKRYKLNKISELEAAAVLTIFISQCFEKMERQYIFVG